MHQWTIIRWYWMKSKSDTMIVTIDWYGFVIFLWKFLRSNWLNATKYHLNGLHQLNSWNAYGICIHQYYNIRSVIWKIELSSPFNGLYIYITYISHMRYVCVICTIHQRNFLCVCAVCSYVDSYTPHVSCLRSNYSSEINQFYKSKIQSHAPFLATVAYERIQTTGHSMML